jgi:hypothetical protein
MPGLQDVDSLAVVTEIFLLKLAVMTWTGLHFANQDISTATDHYLKLPSSRLSPQVPHHGYIRLLHSRLR